MKNKKGFTLIELLVVVLIIGILAAVALPQYTRTVEISRTREAVINLKAILDAQERYFFENGKYTNDVSDLDVQVSNTDKFSYSCKENRTCEVRPLKNSDYVFEFHTQNGGGDAFASYQGQQWCISQNQKGDRICTALGGKKTSEWSGTIYYRVN